MKKYIMLISMLFVIFLTACSQQGVEEEEPQFLDVQLDVNPEKAKPGEEITFSATVTYGEEKVNDADDFKFEIWRAHAEEHETIVVEKGVDGVYSVKKSFAEEGTYYVISHVTARSMHNMPKKEFTVGKPSKPESTSQSSVMDEDEDTEDHEGH